jgi:hypothetical protein
MLIQRTVVFPDDVSPAREGTAGRKVIEARQTSINETERRIRMAASSKMAGVYWQDYGRLDDNTLAEAMGKGRRRIGDRYRRTGGPRG